MSKKKEKIPIQGKEIPIKWHIPDNIITRFASNITIQLIENEFKISFYELKPEIRIDASLPLPTEVKADCVASVIVTADRLPKFINVLQKQYNKYMESKKS